MLPTVVGQMTSARGAEESTEWRQPEDLIAVCDEAAGELSGLLHAHRSAVEWSGHAALAEDLLGDNPKAIVDAISTAIRRGAAPIDLGRSLAYAAALRVARFGNANEHGDWETAHHVFTHANALHRMLERFGASAADGHAHAVRGVLHGAMALYPTRYLNVPRRASPATTASRWTTCPPSRR